MVQLNSYHTKYRPATFDEVLGHSSIVKSLRNLIAKDSTRAIAFSGPSGVGKSTLARIVAREWGCEDNDVWEVDAARYTGVEDIREVLSNLSYRSFSPLGRKVLILDEAHMLSKSSWNSLLKTLEEPPAHCMIILATTEASKIPKTIVTRCSVFNLKPLKYDDLVEIVAKTIEEEDLKLDAKVIRAIIEKSEGSPRQALVNLALVADISSKEVALELLERPDEKAQVIELCRALNNGKSWQEVSALYKELEDDPDNVFYVCLSYFRKVAYGKNAVKALEIIDVLLNTYNPIDKKSSLLLALGKIVIGE